MRHQTWLLHRIEPEINARRYYYIGLGQTLLDSRDTVSVYRIYGRIGGAQHHTPPKQFHDTDQALAYVQKLINHRLHRGYTLVSGDPPPP